MAAMNPPLLLLEQVCRPLYGLEVSHVHNGDQCQSFYLNRQLTLERKKTQKGKEQIQVLHYCLLQKAPKHIPASSSPNGHMVAWPGTPDVGSTVSWHWSISWGQGSIVY